MDTDQNYLYELTQIMAKLDKIISLLELRNSQNEPKKSEMAICNCDEPRHTSGAHWCDVHGYCY